MKISTFINRYIIAFVLCLLISSINAFGQRNYATTQRTGTGGLCLGCTPNNAANAADGNLQTFSQLNVTVGLGAQSWQELIFPGSGKVAANIPVTVKLGTGNNLLDVTLLGGVLLQAYNGNTAVGQPVAASTLLSALSNNNQTEVTLTPNQTYDRLRVTLDGGLLGVASSIYVYDAFYNGTGAVACNTAIDELHGISSNLLGLGVGLGVGGVDNPGGAIDGDLTTFSTLNAGIGVVGGFAQQTVIFSKTSVQGDSVRLTMALPQALIDAGVLANISILTYNGNTSNNDPHTFNDALISLRLLDLTGPTRKVTVTYAPSAVFDRVQLRLGSGIASLLSSLNLYEAQRVIPRPVIKFNNVVTNSVQTCAGSAVTLIANAVPNTTFNWYNVATGGSPVATGASFTTPNLAATTTYYVEAVRAGCTDASERTPVTITVNAIPTAPVIANPAITVCQGSSATFAAQTVAGITVNWYTTPAGGTPVFSGDSFTTGPLTAATTTYYAEATAGGGQCISPTRTAVTATVSTPPATPALTNASLTICDGDVAVLTVASPVSGVVYNWYSSATNGTILHTGENFTTAALHANASYYVEAVNATGCASTARAQATITVQPKPADPILMAGNTIVSAGQSTTIAVSNSQTGITYNWYTSATAASPVFTGTPFTTPALYTNTTYYVSAVNSTGCQSVNRTAITINVTINTNAPCSFAKTETHSVTGICVGCSVDNGALAVDADTTTASTMHIVLGVGGTVQQTVVFQNPGFAGDTIKLGLQAPVGLADVGVLSAIRVTFYNGAVAGATYTLDNSLLTLRLLGSNKYAAFVPATGPYDRISIQLAGTVSALNALSVYYAVQQFSKPVFNPVAPEICKGSTAVINITSPENGGSFAWFTTPTNGTAVGTGTTFTTPVLNANTVYYVEYTRNGCVSPVRVPVNVLVNDVPLKPVAAFNSTTITSGQTATLTATAANNATVKWYADATGGVPLFTGNNFTTPALTADKTYYAESSLGNCVSVDRTPVTVNVTAVVVPDVTVTPPTAAINPGTTASFTASSTTPGTIFNWYTTPTGGTSIFTGANFTTPAQFANTTYYAEAVVQATGVKSATRAPAAVTIIATSSSAVPCDAAIDQTNSVSSLLCVLCSISNAPAAVDADRNTFSQINVPVGLVGYAQQTLRFAGTGRAGDSVVVELGVPGSLASVGVLSGISLATYNGATYNNDRFTVDGSLVSLTVLGGQSRFRVVFKATQDFDRVEIRLNSVASVLSALNVYDAYQEVAAPVITTNAVTACSGAQTTLTATVPSYVTVKWYTSPTGGTPVFTGTTFTTPALTATTVYYAEASRTGSGCAQAVRTPATVTINPLPAPPVVPVSTVTTCAGSPAVFAVTPVTGVTYNWYSASAGGTPLFTGTTFTTPNLTATTSYYVEASNGSCGNTTRTQVTASVSNAVADAVVDQTTVQTCSGSSATLTASSPQPGVNFRWYTVAAAGTPVFTGAQFVTPAITANTSYYVEAFTGSCVSTNRVKVDVVANPAPVAPTVVINPANGQVNAGQTATFTASSTTAGAAFNWYTAPIGGTPIATGATFTTPALTSNTTYYVEAVGATGGCPSARTPVNVTVVPIPNTNCDFASTQTNQVDALCVLCTVADGGNAVDNNLTNFTHLHTTVGLLGASVSQTLIFSDQGSAADSISVQLRLPAPLLTVGVLSGITVTSFNGGVSNNDGVTLDNNLITLKLLADGQTVLVKFKPGNTYDRVQVKLSSGVLSAFNDLDVFYATKQVEAPQLVTNTVNACAGSPVTFTVSNPRTGVHYNWYDAANGGTLLFTGTAFTPSPSPTVTTTYFVESARDGSNCPNPNRVAATANITPSPVPPVLAANSPQICAGDNVILSVTNAGTNTVKWYDAPVGGNLLFTGANYQVSPIVLTSYFVELSNGSCSSPARVTATVTVNPRPAKPGVQSANVTVCTGGAATLAVLTPEAGVTYNWYDAAVGGTKITDGPVFNTPVLTQNTSYYVEAVSATGTCVNNGGRTQVNVNVGDVIANPTLSAASTTVCSGGAASISVVNPTTGLTYKWYTDAVGGTPVFTGTNFTINNLTANATYYVEASSATGCLSAGRTKTDIIVQPVPNPPTVETGANGLSVCIGSGASLRINNPQPDITYRWFDAATNGVLLFTGTQFNTPALTKATTYYVEALQAGNCNASARTTVTVTVNDLPTDPTLVSTDVLVCAGSPATFKIASPQTGVIYQWFSSPDKTTKLFEGNTFVSAAITANTTFYVSGINVSGCSSTNLISVTATIQAAPPAPIIANGATTQTCSGTQVALSIANPQPGFTYNWYDAAVGGKLLTTGTTFTTTTLTPGNVSYYAEAVNSTGCTSASRAQVAITVNPLPDPAVVTANGTAAPTICAGTAITLNATSATANVTFNWYTAPAGGTPIFTGANYSPTTLANSTTFYVEAVSALGCSSSTRTAIPVTVIAPPATPVPAAATVTVCVGSPATLAVSAPAAGITYNWYDSATKAKLLFTGPTYKTGPQTVNATYFVEASNGSCNSSTLASVQVVVNALPAAPAVVNANMSACPNTQAILAVANPQAGFTYNWYSSAVGSTSLFTGNNFTTPIVVANTTYFVEAVNSTGCASASRTAVNVTLAPAPVAPTAGTQGTDICAGGTTTISAVNVPAGVTIKWYAAAAGGTALATGNAFTTPVLNANTTYYAEASNDAGCTSPTRTPVAIIVRQVITAPVVTVASTTTGSITFQWGAVNGATSYEVSINNGATFITPSSGATGLTHTVSGLKVNQSVTIIVRANGTTGCQLSANSAAVTGTTDNPFGDGIFVPNAFTPNGDGKNDILYVYGNTIKSLTLTIYDQYGEQIFRATNIANGWDGTYKGSRQPVGVYVYYVEAIMNDGQTVKKKGSITLLR